MLNIYPVLLLINEVVGGGYVNDSSMAAKQPVHWFFLGGKGLSIQEGTRRVYVLVRPNRG